jgi:hypothetical protein
MLSAIEPDASGLARVHLDVLAWRMPENGFDWVNVLDATTLRFFSAETENATLLIARSEPRWEWREGGRILVGAQYVYQDEVIDASSLDYGLGTTPATLHSFSIDPAIQWKPGSGWELRIRGGAKYDDFQPPLDDYREWRGDLGVTRDFGSKGALTLTAVQLWRDYVERNQATAGGRPIPGTSLSVTQRSLDLRHLVKGGESWKWDVTARVGWLDNRDNGSGWYDYDRTSLALSGALERGRWRVEADVGWRHYDYRVQTSGFGEFEAPTKRDNLTAFMRVERLLSDSLLVFVEGDMEDSTSNDPFIVYDDLTLVLGLRWSR